MTEIIMWAFANGILAGGIGAAIVLIRRERRLTERHVQAIAELRERLGRMDEVHHRLAEVEERLDFAERRLGRSPEPDRPS